MVDRSLYSTFEMPPLLGVFRHIVDVSLAAIEAPRSAGEGGGNAHPS
jgi:hypothetical protein